MQSQRFSSLGGECNYMEKCSNCEEVQFKISDRLVKIDICKKQLPVYYSTNEKYAHNPICNIGGKKVEECRFNQGGKGS